MLGALGDAGHPGPGYSGLAPVAGRAPPPGLRNDRRTARRLAVVADGARVDCVDATGLSGVAAIGRGGAPAPSLPHGLSWCLLGTAGCPERLTGRARGDRAVPGRTSDPVDEPRAGARSGRRTCFGRSRRSARSRRGAAAPAAEPHVRAQQPPACQTTKKASTSPPSIPPSALVSAQPAEFSQSVKKDSTSPPSTPPSWL